MAPSGLYLDLASTVRAAAVMASVAAAMVGSGSGAQNGLWSEGSLVMKTAAPAPTTNYPPGGDAKDERGYNRPVDLTRAEIDEMLRRADEVRRKLRRATRELASLGEQLLRSRDPASRGDRSR